MAHVRLHDYLPCDPCDSVTRIEVTDDVSIVEEIGLPVRHLLTAQLLSAYPAIPECTVVEHLAVLRKHGHR